MLHSSNLVFRAIRCLVRSVGVWLCLVWPASAGESDTPQKNIRSVVDRIASDRNIPSVSVSVRTSQWSLDHQHHHPELKPQPLFGIGSTTKMLAAVVVLHLVENERLALDHNVAQYVGQETIDSITGLDQVTVKQLLGHTSGLSDYANNPEWMRRVVQNDAPITFRDKTALVQRKLSSPGKFAYSNTNYTFLEQVIQTITETDAKVAFRKFYSERNLSLSIGPPEKRLQAFFARTERGSADVSAWRERYGFDGGAYATSQELSRFLTKLFGEKTLLSGESLELLQQWNPMPQSITVGRGSIAEYGNGLMKLTYGNDQWVGHAGGTLKYQSFAFYNLAKTTSIAVTTNCAGPPYNRAFYQELLPAILDQL